MNLTNVEIKARCDNPDAVRTILKKHEADFKGTDHQTDTYFKVPAGRLKLREGSIEQNLIFYRRDDQTGPKTSSIELMPVDDASQLKPVLTAALGVQVVVQKQREIYFIENVKFHIDQVQALGAFVEIEAITQHNHHSQETLHRQCRTYMQLLNISDDQLLSHSYADMLQNQTE